MCFRCTSMLSRGSLAGLLHPAASYGVRILSSSVPNSVAVANLRCGLLRFPDYAGSRPPKSSPRQQPMSVAGLLGLLAVASLLRLPRSEKQCPWCREPRLQGVAPLTSPFCAAALLPTAQSILPWVCFPSKAFPTLLVTHPPLQTACRLALSSDPASCVGGPSPLRSLRLKASAPFAIPW